MFVRVSHYQMKPEAVEGAKAKLEALKGEIMALPGVVRFTNSINPDGKGCAMSVNESQAQSDANSETVQKIWSHFKDDLTAPPEISGFEVFADWSN